MITVELHIENLAAATVWSKGLEAIAPSATWAAVGNTHTVTVGSKHYVTSYNRETHMGTLTTEDVAPVQSGKLTADDAGAYRNADGIFKVYRARSGEHMLAKKLIVDEEARTAEWEYQGGAGRFVLRSQKMTLTEAKEFGVQFGICCCCGRTLTNPDSIEAGIGPICATKGF